MCSGLVLIFGRVGLSVEGRFLEGVGRTVPLPAHSSTAVANHNALGHCRDGGFGIRAVSSWKVENMFLMG